MTRIVRVTVRSSVGALLLGVALAQQPASAGPEGSARTIDGRTIDGQLAVAADGAATIGSVSIALADILSFECKGAVEHLVTAPHRVWLRSGQELPALALRGKPAAAGKPAQLSITLPAGLVVDVPLAAIRAVRHGGSERPEPPLFAADLKAPPANNDLVYVQKDGKSQRSQVTVTGLQDDKIEFRLRDKDYDFGFAGLVAVVFGSNTGVAPDRQPRPRTTLELVSGERLEGRLVGVDTNARLRTDEGATIDVPLDRLLRLRVASDRLVWLSDLIPTVEQTPAFDRTWPWTNDRSQGGPGLVIGKQHFDRGIGMVPRTRLTYRLDRAYDVFEAWIGIDDRGGPAAHAIFRVLVDGKVAYESQPKTLGQPAEAVRVELGKCRELAIETDFGKNYDLGDFCAFADARVVQR